MLIAIKGAGDLATGIACRLDTDPESAILRTYCERLPEIDPSGTFTLSLKKL